MELLLYYKIYSFWGQRKFSMILQSAQQIAKLLFWWFLDHSKRYETLSLRAKVQQLCRGIPACTAPDERFLRETGFCRCSMSSVVIREPWFRDTLQQFDLARKGLSEITSTFKQTCAFLKTFTFEIQSFNVLVYFPKDYNHKKALIEIDKWRNKTKKIKIIKVERNWN